MPPLTSLPYYDNAVSARIAEMAASYDYVYHLMHPFRWNADGPDELYHEALEDQIFEYRLNNLIFHHFGTLQGFSDHILHPDEELIEHFVRGNIALSDTTRWFSIQRHGVSITPQEHPEFYQALHDLALAYFAKAEQQHYYAYGDYRHHHSWSWESIFWKELCQRLSIPYDSDIRFTRIWHWMEVNGRPLNIQLPAEQLDAGVIEEISQAAQSSSMQIAFSTGRDAYETILGSTQPIEHILKEINVEFFAIKPCFMPPGPKT